MTDKKVEVLIYWPNIPIYLCAQRERESGEQKTKVQYYKSAQGWEKSWEDPSRLNLNEKDKSVPKLIIKKKNRKIIVRVGVYTLNKNRQIMELLVKNLKIHESIWLTHGHVN